MTLSGTLSVDKPVEFKSSTVTASGRILRIGDAAPAVCDTSFSDCTLIVGGAGTISGFLVRGGTLGLLDSTIKMEIQDSTTYDTLQASNGINVGNTILQVTTIGNPGFVAGNTMILVESLDGTLFGDFQLTAPPGLSGSYQPNAQAGDVPKRFVLVK